MRAIRPDELAHTLSNAEKYVEFANEQLLPIPEPPETPARH